MHAIKFFTLLLLSGALLVGCDYESFEEESALVNLQQGNRFVRLDNSIVGNALEATVSEEDTTFSVAVANPFNSGSDVTVSYSLGGTAEYGEIYTIDGASASGGDIVLPFQENAESVQISQEDIVINFLVDTLLTAPQTIELTLTGASASGGESFDVGQGDLFGNVTITLVND